MIEARLSRLVVRATEKAQYGSIPSGMRGTVLFCIRSLLGKWFIGGPITKIDTGLPWTSSKTAFKDNMVGVEGANTVNSGAEINE